MTLVVTFTFLWHTTAQCIDCIDRFRRGSRHGEFFRAVLVRLAQSFQEESRHLLHGGLVDVVALAGSEACEQSIYVALLMRANLNITRALYIF